VNGGSTVPVIGVASEANAGESSANEPILPSAQMTLDGKIGHVPSDADVAGRGIPDATAAPEESCLSLPTVSVLVAGWNEAARIDACLASLEAIAWPGMEILVSAGGDDGSFEVARRHAGERLTVLPQLPGQGKQAALRELLAVSSGEVIYLTDGDSVVPESTLRAVIAPIARGEVEVVTGTCRPYREDVMAPLVFYQWSIDRAVERRRGPDSEGLLGANTAVTRRALTAVGGFDPVVPTGTDYHLARRLRAAGYRIRYVDAAVETEYSSTSRVLMRRRSRWLRNTLLHGYRLGDRAAVQSSVTTMAMSLGVLALPLTFSRWLKWGGFAWCAVFGMLTARRFRYAAELGEELGMRIPAGVVVRMPLLTMIDLAASVVAIADLRSEKGRARW
jgi:cellulose synthase/poly-beta-1,6-N-acetylglucosamine synthase-like glycosyltransferase